MVLCAYRFCKKCTLQFSEKWSLHIFYKVCIHVIMEKLSCRQLSVHHCAILTLR